VFGCDNFKLKHSFNKLVPWRHLALELVAFNIDGSVLTATSLGGFSCLIHDQNIFYLARKKKELYTSKQFKYI